MIEEVLEGLEEPRRTSILKYHTEHLSKIDKVPAAIHNHQTWPGGYRDHIIQCFGLARNMYSILPVPFSFDSIIVVLYFHDIEKLFKDTPIDKDDYYDNVLPNTWNINFTSEERNALKYAHGEGDDYRPDKRVMNELAAFCHCVDTISARIYHSVKGIDDETY